MVDSTYEVCDVVDGVVEGYEVMTVGFGVVELGFGRALVGSDEGVLGGRAHSGWEKRKKLL